MSDPLRPVPKSPPKQSTGSFSGPPDITATFPAPQSAQRLTVGYTPRLKEPTGPGYSQADWQRLAVGDATRSGSNGIRRIPVSELTRHNTAEDCWLSFQGKVYDVTKYLSFHPGGKAQLMRVAGKDATELFFKTHHWVNGERILEKCLIGFLVHD